MGVRFLFISLFFHILVLVGHVTAAAEMDPVKRTELKSQWKLNQDAVPFKWEYVKRVPSWGNLAIQFKSSYSIANLPTIVQNLATKPWHSMVVPVVNPMAEKSEAAFDSKPVLEFRVVDIEAMDVFHETTFKSYEGLIKDPKTTNKLEGTLQSDQIRFSNSASEPGFYSHVDPGNGFMLGRLDELLLKLRIKNKNQVFLLVLNEPIGETERAQLLDILSEGKENWPKIKETNSNSSVYDFDIFHNTVVRVLRERHKIPVDLLIYTLDWTPRLMGRPSRMIYNWPIFYDRQTLAGTELVDAYFYPLVSKTPYRGSGIGDSRFPRLNRQALDLFSKSPEFAQKLTQWVRPSSWMNEEINRRALQLGQSDSAVQEEFWQHIYNEFCKEITDSLFSKIAEQFNRDPRDEQAIKDVIRQSLVSYWDLKTKGTTDTCGNLAAKVN